MIKLTSTPAIIMSISGIVIVIFTLSILYLPIQITYSHHVVKEIALTDRPMKMSLDEPLLFVSNLGKPVISIISTVSDNVAGTINTSNGIIDVEGVNDKNKVYVATFASGELEVYDLTTK